MQDHLTVVGFHGKHRASEVLSQLQQLAYDWTLDLKDAVAAYRTDDGRLRVDKSVQPTAKEGAGYGAVIAGVLGALVAAPFTGGLSVAAAAAKIGVGALTAGTVGGAMAAGLRGVLVRTGKYQPGAETRIDPPPSAVCDDLPAAVELLLAGGVG